MTVIKLEAKHKEIIKPLFGYEEFIDNDFRVKKDIRFKEFHYESFAETYLSNLSNYHAYGAMVNGEVKVMIGFYESIDDASWYLTQANSLNNNLYLIKKCLDVVIEHNECRGRLKFYSMFPAKYAKVYRRLAFSKYNNERYDSFDEYLVKSKNQCLYTLPWQILYNRSLTEVETVVRCSFLKQKYRTSIINGGNL